MRRQDHRSCRVFPHPALHLAPHVASRAHVERDGRLVEEKHARIGHEAADQVHLLAHSARQTGDLLVRGVGEAQALEQLVDAPAGRFRVHPVELAEHPELLADLQDPVAGLLAAGDHADPAAQVLEVAHNIEAVDEGLARCRQQQRDQDLDQGRLSGSVRAKHSEQLALTDREVHVFERGRHFPTHFVDARQPSRFDGRA